MSEEKALWRYIPLGTFHGNENMAIDEYILNSVVEKKCPNTIRLYKWAPSTVSIGQHQSLSAEIDIEQARMNGIDVVRRISGGGAVFHDALGEITYAIICNEKNIPTQIQSPRVYDSTIPIRYHAILEALAKGLESIGISIDVGKVHCPALFSLGKKLSGNAQIIRSGVLLQHGTILLSIRPELMYRVLKAPEGVNYTRMVKSVKTKVTGIYDTLDASHRLNEEQIVNAILTGFRAVFNIQTYDQSITTDEWKIIKYLLTTKYETKAWLEKFP